MSDLHATSSADALELATQSYEGFPEDIKSRIRSAQARAARAINAELIEVYWQIGLEILRRQHEEGPELGRRTRGVVQRLSADLRAAFPGARGYSAPNLYRMRAFAAAWPDPEGLSDHVRDLPWGHVAMLVVETDAGFGIGMSSEQELGHGRSLRRPWRVACTSARGSDHQLRAGPRGGRRGSGAAHRARSRGQVIALTLVNAKWLLERDGEVRVTIPSHVSADELAPAMAP
jgi:hypothetical protein